MDDHAIQALQAKAFAFDALLSTVVFAIMSNDPDARAKTVTMEEAVRAGLESALENPGPNAPEPFILHAALHEVEKFWTGVRSGLPQ